MLPFAVLALMAFALWLWRRWRRPTIKKLALSELDRIATDAGDVHEQVQRLAILLRRVCLSTYPREEVGGLAGEAWLSFLDGPLGDRRFSEGVGRLLLEAPYRREIEVDSTNLLALCREWLLRLPEPGKSSCTKPLAKKP
jgi:hypothetical protein